MVDVVALPDEKASPHFPFSRSATFASKARRVGLSEREYSKPLWTPGESCWKVVDKEIGIITAPIIQDKLMYTLKKRGKKIIPEDGSGS